MFNRWFIYTCIIFVIPNYPQGFDCTTIFVFLFLCPLNPIYDWFVTGNVKHFIVSFKFNLNDFTFFILRRRNNDDWLLKYGTNFLELSWFGFSDSIFIFDLDELFIAQLCIYTKKRLKFHNSVKINDEWWLIIFQHFLQRAIFLNASSVAFEIFRFCLNCGFVFLLY